MDLPGLFLMQNERKAAPDGCAEPQRFFTYATEATYKEHLLLKVCSAPVNRVTPLYPAKEAGSFSLLAVCE
jgi:hypothetical protein